MATKRTTKRKANGHARPVESDFEIGFFPVPAETLTPKAAARWLEHDAPLFHEAVQEALRVANTEEIEALAWFNFGLGQTVQAAARALTSGRPARLSTDRDGDAIKNLALVLRAATRIGDREGLEPMMLLHVRSVLESIADAIVRAATEPEGAEQQARRAA
jgi:hypothetical protein